MNEISKKLRMLRSSRGLSQKEVAEFLNISSSAYGFYEQGKNMPSLETLTNLCDFYKVPISFFTEDKINYSQIATFLNEHQANKFKIHKDVYPEGVNKNMKFQDTKKYLRYLQKLNNLTHEYNNVEELNISKKTLDISLKNLLTYATKSNNPDLSDEQLDILFDFIIEMIKYKLYDFKTNKYL